MKEVSRQIYDQLVKVVQDGNMKYVSGEMIRCRGRRSGVGIWMVGVDMGSQSVLVNYYVELRESLCIYKGSLLVCLFVCLGLGKRGYQSFCSRNSILMCSKGISDK